MRRSSLASAGRMAMQQGSRQAAPPYAQSHHHHHHHQQQHHQFSHHQSEYHQQQQQQHHQHHHHHHQQQQQLLLQQQQRTPGGGGSQVAELLGGGGRSSSGSGSGSGSGVHSTPAARRVNRRAHESSMADVLGGGGSTDQFESRRERGGHSSDARGGPRQHDDADRHRHRHDHGNAHGHGHGHAHGFGRQQVAHQDHRHAAAHHADGHQGYNPHPEAASGQFHQQPSGGFRHGQQQYPVPGRGSPRGGNVSHGDQQRLNDLFRHSEPGHHHQPQFAEARHFGQPPQIHSPAASTFNPERFYARPDNHAHSQALASAPGAGSRPRQPGLSPRGAPGAGFSAQHAGSVRQDYPPHQEPLERHGNAAESRAQAPMQFPDHKTTKHRPHRASRASDEQRSAPRVAEPPVSRVENGQTGESGTQPPDQHHRSHEQQQARFGPGALHVDTSSSDSRLPSDHRKQHNPTAVDSRGPQQPAHRTDVPFASAHAHPDAGVSENVFAAQSPLSSERVTMNSRRPDDFMPSPHQRKRPPPDVHVAVSNDSGPDPRALQYSPVHPRQGSPLPRGPDHGVPPSSNGQGQSAQAFGSRGDVPAAVLGGPTAAPTRASASNVPSPIVAEFAVGDKVRCKWGDEWFGANVVAIDDGLGTVGVLGPKRGVKYTVAWLDGGADSVITAAHTRPFGPEQSRKAPTPNGDSVKASQSPPPRRVHSPRHERVPVQTQHQDTAGTPSRLVASPVTHPGMERTPGVAASPRGSQAGDRSLSPGAGRAASNTTPRNAHPRSAEFHCEFTSGDEVEGKWGDEWFRAQFVGIEDGGAQATLEWEDGGVRTTVPIGFVRRPGGSTAQDKTLDPDRFAEPYKPPPKQQKSARKTRNPKQSNDRQPTHRTNLAGHGQRSPVAVPSLAIQTNFGDSAQMEVDPNAETPRVDRSAQKRPQRASPSTSPIRQRSAPSQRHSTPTKASRNGGQKIIHNEDDAADDGRTGGLPTARAEPSSDDDNATVSRSAGPNREPSGRTRPHSHIGHGNRAPTRLHVSDDDADPESEPSLPQSDVAHGQSRSKQGRLPAESARAESHKRHQGRQAQQRHSTLQRSGHISDQVREKARAAHERRGSHDVGVHEASRQHEKSLSVASPVSRRGSSTSPKPHLTSTREFLRRRKQQQQDLPDDADASLSDDNRNARHASSQRVSSQQTQNEHQPKRRSFAGRVGHVISLEAWERAAGPRAADRSANAGTDAARSLYAAASEGTVQSSSEKRPDFSVGGDDGMAAAPRKVNDRASRTKELRKQANADANDASVRNLDKRRARRKYRAEFIQAVQRYRDIALHDKFFLSAAKADDDAESNGDDMSRVGSFGHVFIRKRPLLQHEIQRKDWDAVTCLGRRFCVLHDGRMHANMQRKFMLHRRFKFDRVFGMNEDNETVFRETTLPLVEAVTALNRRNATLFMFGQTGSGKTYTMSSLLERAAAQLFETLTQESTECVVTLSCVELVGGDIRDLLSTKRNPNRSGGTGTAGGGAGLAAVRAKKRHQLKNGNKKKRASQASVLAVLTDTDGNTYVRGATEVAVPSPAALLQLLATGMRARATSATGVHNQSSRSHALCYIRVRQGQMAGATVNCASVLGTLLLIDLAGSERNEDSWTHSAELQKETIEINKSLNALKECFRLRSQGTTYLPLRQNLLTRLLKSALVDEDSLAAVIATVSPAAADTEHSHNTLRHACQMDGQPAPFGGKDVGAKMSFASNKQLDAEPIGVAENADQRGTGEHTTIVELYPDEGRQTFGKPPGQWDAARFAKWWEATSARALESMSAGRVVPPCPPNLTGKMAARFNGARWLEACQGKKFVAGFFMKQWAAMLKEVRANNTARAKQIMEQRRREQ